MTTPETVFTGRKFEVERRTVQINGAPHIFDIIVHPGAAVILPILPDGRLVLIHVYREAVRQELLELPAGTIDPGETPAACAVRELAEETGYRAGRIEPLVACFSSPGILNEHMHGFVATDLTPGPTALDAGEQIRTTIMTHADALAAVQAGRITDGKTVLMLLYYDRFVRRAGGAV